MLQRITTVKGKQQDGLLVPGAFTQLPPGVLWTVVQMSQHINMGPSGSKCRKFHYNFRVLSWVQKCEIEQNNRISLETTSFIYFACENYYIETEFRF